MKCKLFINRFFNLSFSLSSASQETVSVFLLRHLTDEPDLEGRTAFMWAAGTGADDVIRASLSAGVDIQQEDKTGGTGDDEQKMLQVLCDKIQLVLFFSSLPLYHNFVNPFNFQLPI